MPLQGIGGKRVRRDRFHERQSKFEQFTGAKHVSHRTSYSRTVVARFREQAADNLGEESIGPVLMSAIAGGVKFLHCTPHPTALLHYGHFITRDSLVWNLGDMFNVVEEGYSIVIGAQQYDLAVEHQKSFQRGIRTESIIPRLAGHEVFRLLTPEDEAGDMRIYARVGIRPEKFNE